MNPVFLGIADILIWSFHTLCFTFIASVKCIVLWVCEIFTTCGTRHCCNRVVLVWQRGCDERLAFVFYLEYFPGELACQFGLEGNCVIHETTCLLLRCFNADISQHPPSPPSLSSSLHNPCLIAQTVIYGASLKTLLLSQMSLQWDISNKEPICIHANEVEWVHPSWWACKHTVMHTQKPLNQLSL